MIVSDDEKRRTQLAGYLSSSGHLVEAISLEQSVREVAFRCPEAVVVLASLPNLRVSELLRSMSRSGRADAVTLVSDTGDLVERVLALEMGVNDLIAESCDPREILTRINGLLTRSARLETSKSVLRRGYAGAHSRGVWVLNERTRELIAPGGKACELTPQGLSIINDLIERPDCLLGRLSGEDGSTRLLRTSISRLRKQLARRGVGGFPVRTVHGVGYVLDAEIKRMGEVRS